MANNLFLSLSIKFPIIRSRYNRTEDEDDVQSYPKLIVQFFHWSRPGTHALSPGPKTACGRIAAVIRFPCPFASRVPLAAMTLCKQQYHKADKRCRYVNIYHTNHKTEVLYHDVCCARLWEGWRWSICPKMDSHPNFPVIFLSMVQRWHRIRSALNVENQIVK